MARECGDCYWSEIKRTSDSYYWKCKKRSRRIESDDSACSEFRSEDVKTCQECEYYEEGKYKWNTHGTCSLKGTRRSDDDKACSSFYEA